MSRKGWIGVDLDGTLAEYHGWVGEHHIGAPIQPMVDRIRAWLAEGREVRIFTARASSSSARVRIMEWLKEVFPGHYLPITNVKDLRMVELWDDRAVQVVPNTGLRADGRE